MRVLAAALLAALVLPGTAPAQTLQKVRIGVTPGPHAQILEAVKPIAAQKGLDLEIKEFSDYVVPNAALDAGELDANSFQHGPYLDNQKTDRGFKIEAVALTVNFPLGFYSRKHKSFEEVPTGGTVAIQNDPTNGGRALLLLQDHGVIKLKAGVGLKPSILDIADNPKKLKILEIDAAQAPRTLDDVDAAAVNTNYVVTAGLDPAMAILKEDPKGPYANVIAVRAVDKDKPWVRELVAAYHSPQVKDFIVEKFKGAVIPAW